MALQIPILDQVIGFIPWGLKTIKSLAMNILPGEIQIVLLIISILLAYVITKWDLFLSQRFWMVLILSIMIYAMFLMAV